MGATSQVIVNCIWHHYNLSYMTAVTVRDKSRLATAAMTRSGRSPAATRLTAPPARSIRPRSSPRTPGARSHRAPWPSGCPRPAPARPPEIPNGAGAFGATSLGSQPLGVLGRHRAGRQAGREHLEVEVTRGPAPPRIAAQPGGHLPARSQAASVIFTSRRTRSRPQISACGSGSADIFPDHLTIVSLRWSGQSFRV